MPDLLVKLYDLVDDWSFMGSQANRGVTIRKPIGPEKHDLVEWVLDHFNPAWSSEIDIAMSNVPRTCFVAVKDRQFVGLSYYDATALGFFGPIGVIPEHRNQGIGQALLMACMLDMKLKGYGYAIIGSTGLVDWYARYTGAVPIEGSSTSVWATWVKSRNRG